MEWVEPIPPFLVFFCKDGKGSKDEDLAFTDLVATCALPLFLDLAILFITQLKWRCTQTKPVIFLDYSAQFQDSAVLCQDLPVLSLDLSLLATLLRVVNNTHRKRERMNKQEHQCAHFGQVWNRDWTSFEPCCDMNYWQRIIADVFCTNGCKFSFNGFRAVLQDSAMVWECRLCVRNSF